MNKAGRKRISLTVDPYVWERCQVIGKEFGVNWSQVAEEAFVNVLCQMEELKKILDTIPPELRKSAAKANLKKFLQQTHTELNQKLEEEISESELNSKK